MEQDLLIFQNDVFPEKQNSVYMDSIIPFWKLQLLCYMFSSKNESQNTSIHTSISEMTS